MTLSRRHTLTLALLFALLGLLPQALSRTLPDIAFPLWAAERMQHGARLYVDILEINPPLFIWVDLPLVWLSRVAGLGSITCYRIATSLLLFASFAGCWWALKRGLGDERVEYRRLLWLAAAFALLLLPRLDWGEREHLSLALTLPYILLGIARARGRKVPTGGAVLAGLAAGIGIAFKPYFVLVWLGREVASRGSRVAGHESRVTSRATRGPRPETLTVPLLCIAYLAAVILIHPEYFHLLRQLGAAYQDYLRSSILITVFLGDGSAIVLGVLIVALALRAMPKHTAVWRVLVGSMLGYFLAAILQGKGWRYHFYPSLGLAMLLFAAMAWDARRATMGMAGKPVIPAKAGIHDLMRLFAAIPAAVLATAVIVSALLAVRQTAQPLNPRYDADPSLGALIPIVRARATGRPIFVISPNMASGFPLTNYSGAEWGQRLAHLWPIVVAYDSALSQPGPIRYRSPRDMSAVERTGMTLTVDDFLRIRPALVLSLIAVDRVGWGMQRLDLVRWLRQDARFDAAWSDYQLLGSAGSYDVWARRDDSVASRPLQPAPAGAGGEDASPNGVQVNPIAILAGLILIAAISVSYRMLAGARS